MGKIDAKWIGPWGYKLPDGTELIPGETVRPVPEDQANDDPYWSPVELPKPKDNPPSGGDK